MFPHGERNDSKEDADQDKTTVQKSKDVLSIPRTCAPGTALGKDRIHYLNRACHRGVVHRMVYMHSGVEHVHKRRRGAGELAAKALVHKSARFYIFRCNFKGSKRSA